MERYYHVEFADGFIAVVVASDKWEAMNMATTDRWERDGTLIDIRRVRRVL